MNFKTLWPIMFFCCFSMSILSAQTSNYWCDGLHVPLERPLLPISISDPRFTSVGELSLADLQVVNRTTKQIDYFLILVGLFDPDGKHLLSIPFYNVVRKTGETPFSITFSRWLYGHQASGVAPLQPLHTEQLDANSPTVAFTCPASGRVMMVQLKYSDGETFSYASPALSLEPIVVWAPVSDSTFSTRTPIFATAKLSVDANGHAKLIGQEEAPQGLFDLMQKQITTWLFSKPVRDGKPVPSELTLFLCLEDVGSQGQLTPLPQEFYIRMPMLRNRDISTLHVIHAYRWSPDAKRWMVKAGGHFVDKLDERQR